MRNFFSLLNSAFVASNCLVSAGLSAQSATVLDDFSDAATWKVVASDGVVLECQVDSDRGDHPTCLRLDFNFVSGAGYAGLRRIVPMGLPPNFELSFSLRGDLPRNNLEFKLVDETGETVWWVNRRSFEFPHEWTRLASRRRHFQFAWGPSNQPLRRIRSIEIIVASVEGGRGTIWLDDLTFRPLPETKPYTGTPILTASSQAKEDCAAQLAFDQQANTAWQPAATDRQPTLTMDFGQSREFGGIVVHWDPSAFAEQYQVQISDDGESWTTIRTVERNTGQPQFLSLPDCEAGAVRLVMQAPRLRPVAVRELEILPLETSANPNAFAEEIARRAPRGHYPRAIGGEGTFWTIVGVPVDEHEGLVSEDGAAEVDKQAFSIEPFLLHDGKLLTWAEARITQSLANRFVPVPTVTRDYDGVRLTVTVAADGEAGRSALTLLYNVTNTSQEPATGALWLAVRPFQVNPPYQWLNSPGGIARIGRIEFDRSHRTMRVDDRLVAFSAKPDALYGATLDEGDFVALLSAEPTSSDTSVTDPQRAASAALRFNFHLEPRGSQSWAAVVPFGYEQYIQQQLVDEFAARTDHVASVRARQLAMIDQWGQTTQTFDLLVPEEATDMVNTIRSTLAYILINQDGQAIHPGSRSYERSWIRDGSLTSAALLRFGLERHARKFVDWYAPYQFESGKVPCVVDHRGPDPVPENDSHGELIMAVMNVYRFTGDEAFLQRHWPRVQKAVAYIEQLRAQRMTDEFTDVTATRQEPGKPPVSLKAFYGLMPESISHEGYSTKPMHSYWDDFFTLKGLKDAAEMAQELNNQEAAERYQKLADDFAHTLYNSIDLAMQAHQIDYIPGCVELGDFDATSTTIALWPCGELERLPQPALTNTFERYWNRFVGRRDDPQFVWADYTPYELRTIGSLILLGDSDRAQQALGFFMKDRTPPAWNQWPEVVYREPRTPKFLGDLPHTWCASDFVNSVRMMFLYEDEVADSVVLLAGVPSDWIDDTPVGFRNMPTYGGRLTCTLARQPGQPNELVAHLEGTCPVPSGALRLCIAGNSNGRAIVNGAPAQRDAAGRVIVKELPADVTLHVAQPR